MVERYNAILAKTMEKLTLDHNHKYPSGITITWTVNTKNTFHNYSGFSPNPLVFEHNPSLPSVLTNEFPAMEESTNNLLKRHLNTITKSRKTFAECESNEKLGRAIRSKSRLATSFTHELVLKYVINAVILINGRALEL